MGFASFLGRVLFASLFILSAWQMFDEFGDDGGPAAKEWTPKLAAVQEFITSQLGSKGPNIDVRHFVAASIIMKGLGGLLFVFGSNIGAYLLIYHLLYTTPLFYDFYKYGPDEQEFFNQLQGFAQNVALLGALLYFLGMKNTILRRNLRKKAAKAKAA